MKELPTLVNSPSLPPRSDAPSEAAAGSPAAPQAANSAKPAAAAAAPAAVPTPIKPAAPKVVPAAKPAPKPAANPAPPAAPPKPPAGYSHIVASAARPRRRHWLLVASLVIFGFLPGLLATAYLYLVAEEQYASRLGFSVQKENGISSMDVLGAMGLGSSNTPDAEIVYKYISSRDMMLRVEEQIDLSRAFIRPGDPVYSLREGASVEEREAHWHSMVKVFMDSNSGLLEILVRAYTPEDSQTIAAVIRDESTRLLNQLSDAAREDATRYARSEMELAAKRQREAQAALTEFRSRTQIVDPSIDFAGRTGLLNSLMGQKANALIERDLLLASNVREEDPRFQQVERRIDVISHRIEAERASIREDDEGVNGGFARLMADYETLRMEHEFAAQSYIAAKTALDAAMAQAERTTRYLAVYMPPTLSEASEYPKRLTWSLLISALALALWAIAALTYYAVRDRR